MVDDVLEEESVEIESCDISTLEEKRDKYILDNYTCDESSILKGSAETVFFPVLECQAIYILRRANRMKKQVTVSGAGTGLTGARVPLKGDVLATDKMTVAEPHSSKEYESLFHKENGKMYLIYLGWDDIKKEYFFIAPPGIPLDILNNLLETRGLMYPPNPTEKKAYLGGTVATNASGSRTFYYGMTRDFIRRLRIILPTGNIVDIRRENVYADKRIFIMRYCDGQEKIVYLPAYNMPSVKKNSAGYYVKDNMDIIDLFIGSEGTLGVFTEIEGRLVKKPRIIMPIYAHFRDSWNTLKFVDLLREYAWSEERKILSIEFFDENAVKFIRVKYPPPLIPDESRGIIFFEVAADDEDELYNTLTETEDLLSECNVLKEQASDDPKWGSLAKEIRHALPDGINNYVRRHGCHKVATDIAVPKESFEEMMQYYHFIGGSSGIFYVMYGHIGDFHIHFNFLPRNEDELDKALKYSLELMIKGVDLGGTVTAEHGVGKKKYVVDNIEKPLLELMYGEKGLLEIAKVKNSLDPNHILNIGNIIPEVYLNF